jgi:hypothetical protein
LFKDGGDERLARIQAIADRNIIEFNLLDNEDVAG